MHCGAPLHGARPPGLLLVREPDELGVERAHLQLAFGVRLVELAGPNRHVAAEDDRTPARLEVGVDRGHHSPFVEPLYLMRPGSARKLISRRGEASRTGTFA